MATSTWWPPLPESGVLWGVQALAENAVTPKTRTTEGKLAAGSEVSLRPALPFPRLLLLLPDRVHTPRNTPAISL